METKTVECRSCHASFEAPVHELFGVQKCFKVFCDPCTDDMEKKQAEGRREYDLQRIEDKWNAICPPLYRNTVPSRLPDHFLQAVDEWSYGPKGIGFISPAGKGKTRAAFLLLRSMFNERRKVSYLTSTRLAILCADQFSDHRDTKAAAQWVMDEVRTCDLLLLDDLGKNKMTERCEMELFDILEERTSHLLPTIWTANTDAIGLKAMLSPDRGDPILRRLCEFSEIIKA